MLTKKILLFNTFIQLLSALSCPNIVFEQQPSEFRLLLDDKERKNQNCGGHPHSQTNFVLHDDKTAATPYFSASFTFEHYNTENICFEELISHGDKEYQTEAIIIKLVKDVHTAPVHNYAKRASDLTFTFKDEYHGLNTKLKPNKAKQLAETLCPQIASYMKTVQTWGSLELCGYWNSRYLLAGAACTMPGSYVELIELTGVSPHIAVTYGITTFGRNTTTTELVTMDNKRNADYPGHMRLRSVDFVDSGSLYPHPFSTKNHVVKGEFWYEFIDGKMNKIDEQNTQKAFWAGYGRKGRNKLKNNFIFKPLVTSGNSISATCDYDTNLREIASSATDTLTLALGAWDFRVRPTFNQTDKTVRAEGHRNMRIRPTFEIRLPIVKTITRSGIVGTFECLNLDRNGTFYDDQILTCNITQLVRPGIVTFHVIYNCEIIATIKVNPETDLQFEIPIAVYNGTMTGAICTQFGECVELAIGRNVERKRIYKEKPNTPIRQSPSEGTSSNWKWGWFRGAWNVVVGFFSNIFSMPWKRYLVIGVVSLASILLVILVFKCGCVGCFRCQRRSRHRYGERKHEVRNLSKYDQGEEPTSEPAVIKRTPPPIIHPKPIIVYLKK